MKTDTQQVRCVHNGAEHIGTYDVEGQFLVLTCAFGTRRVVRGLARERQLAHRLLKNLLAKAEREIAAAAPHPAIIEVAKDAAPARAHRQMTSSALTAKIAAPFG